jgi:putative aldouronate transport system substrate-binding protein
LGEDAKPDLKGRAGRKNPVEVAGSIMYTQEEMEEIGETWSTIQDYVQDSTIRFATGDLNIEQDWDAYLNDLKMMGLERFLEIAQTAYTRMNSYQY